MLWENGISADVMYEAAVDESDEVTITKCQNEGILLSTDRLASSTYAVQVLGIS